MPSDYNPKAGMDWPGWPGVVGGVMRAIRKPVDIATAYYAGQPRALDPGAEIPTSGEQLGEAVLPGSEGSGWREAAKAGLAAAGDIGTDPAMVAGTIAAAVAKLKAGSRAASYTQIPKHMIGDIPSPKVRWPEPRAPSAPRPRYLKPEPRPLSWLERDEYARLNATAKERFLQPSEMARHKQLQRLVDEQPVDPQAIGLLGP